MGHETQAGGGPGEGHSGVVIETDDREVQFGERDDNLINYTSGSFNTAIY